MDNDETKKDNETKNYNPKITEQDKNKLGERTVQQRTDQQGDDAQLSDREKPVDFTGKQLDVPGRTLPSERNTKLKDEENQLYSQGGGHNDHLEDAKENNQ